MQWQSVPETVAVGWFPELERVGATHCSGREVRGQIHAHKNPYAQDTESQAPRLLLDRRSSVLCSSGWLPSRARLAVRASERICGDPALSA